MLYVQWWSSTNSLYIKGVSTLYTAYFLMIRQTRIVKPPKFTKQIHADCLINLQTLASGTLLCRNSIPLLRKKTKY